MFFTTLYRLIKFAGQNFFRNFWLSFVTITIILLSLLSLNGLLAINGLTQAVLATLSRQVDISIYFPAETPSETILLARQQVTAIPEAAEVTLISAQEALDSFRAKHANDPSVIAALSELEANPLGAALQVKAVSLDSYDSLQAKINNLELADQAEDVAFNDRRALIAKLRELSDSVGLGLAVLSGLFLAISIMVVFNTIRLGIYAHREEIGIMKLVGASNLFIRTPFIMEGFLYAFLALAVFWGLLFLLLGWAEPFLAGYFKEISFSFKKFFLDNFWVFSGQQLLGLTVINSLSAAIAIRRYLKV